MGSSTKLHSQTLNTNTLKNKASCPEKRWAFFHPFQIKKSIQITRQVLMDTDSVKDTHIVGQDLSGGQLDAFKHSYWMAILVQEMKSRKAISLGLAHEKGNYQSFKKSKRKKEGSSRDKISSDMDLWNNEEGIKIGQALKGSDRTTIQRAIIDSIQNGKMKIIWRNKSGYFLDCKGAIIPLDSLPGKWINNKCLVPSNVLPK